jgi:hypothetical protein
MSAAANPKRRQGNRFLPAIFAAARERGVTHEELHDTIWMAFKQKSLKDLTPKQSMELLDGLRGRKSQFSYSRRQAMNAHGRRDYDHRGDAEYLVNARELRMMLEAAELRGWHEETLNAFIERQLGRNSIRTMVEFNKVFWALKAMNRRDGLCK